MTHEKHCPNCLHEDPDGLSSDDCWCCTAIRAAVAEHEAEIAALANALVSLIVACGITGGTEPMTGPEVLLLAEDAKREVAALKAQLAQARDAWKTAVVEERARVNEYLAEALHAAECEHSSIYLKDPASIKTAWAADPANRKAWKEYAALTLRWVERLHATAIREQP
jgi:hypothetical protein